MLVKICGVKTIEAAQTAVDAGADLVGMILVPGRARTVDLDTAKTISLAVHSLGASTVGVFRNQSFDQVVESALAAEVDLIQLHGSEPVDWLDKLPLPVIKRFTPSADPQSISGLEDSLGPQTYSLLDSELGGEGKVLEVASHQGVWTQVRAGARFVLAGGLTPDNVAQRLDAVRELVEAGGIVGVDVSGGVEDGGVKSNDKIRRFVRAAKEWT